MGDFDLIMDEEALLSDKEEGEEEGEDISKLHDSSDSEDDEEADNEEVDEETKKFIVDEDINDLPISDTSDLDIAKKRKKKKRKIAEEDEELDEDDLDLVAVNTGVEINKFKKLRKKTNYDFQKDASKLTASSSLFNVDSDDDHMDGLIETKTPQKLKNTLEDLFDENDDIKSPIDDKNMDSNDEENIPAIIKTRKELFEIDDDDEEDEIDKFIEYDDEDSGDEEKRKQDRLMMRKNKKKARNLASDIGISDEAWRDIDEIFGDGSDYAWAFVAGEGFDSLQINDDENHLPKEKKLALENVYEPAEMERMMMTDADEIAGEIKYDEDDALHDARDIANILIREKRWNLEFDEREIEKLDKLKNSIAKTIKFLQKDHFEIPFIQSHRKDYIRLLDRQVLWKILDLTRSINDLKIRKRKITNLIKDLLISNSDLSSELSYFGDQLEVSPSLDEVNDVYSCIQGRFGDIVSELEHRKSERKFFKRPASKKAWERAKECGLDKFAEKYGIDCRAFVNALTGGITMLEGYNPINPEKKPWELAEDYTKSSFPEAKMVMEGARSILAHELGTDPKLRNFVRAIYRADAVVNVRPTEKGKTEIDPHHFYYHFKYTAGKPCFKFRDKYRDGKFLQILKAEEEGLVQMEIKIEAEDHFLGDVYKGICSDESSEISQSWNDERKILAAYVLKETIFPSIVKGMKEKMAKENAEFIIEECQKSLMEDIDMAGFDFPGSKFGNGRVISINWGDGERNTPAIAVVVDEFGSYFDHIRLDKMQESMRPELKDEDIRTLKKFITANRDRDVGLIVAVSGYTPNVKTRLYEDVVRIVGDVNADDRKYSSVEAMFIDNQVARIYSESKRGLKEFPHKDPIWVQIRYGISLCRRVQDPTMEIAGLFNADNEIKMLRLHPLQHLVPEDSLISALERTFMNVVNSCGVDINQAVSYPHKSHTLQFVCGLGRRKAHAMIGKISRLDGRLESRAELIKKKMCATVIFMNCASFIRITKVNFRRRVSEYQLLDVLDDTRIHPEDYDLARKMAADALDVDEEVGDDENPSYHIQELWEEGVKKLDDLDLGDYAEQLERSLNEPKAVTLNEILTELKDPYRERRRRFAPASLDKVFTMLTGETSDTLCIGMVTACRVVRVQDRFVKVNLAGGSGLEGIIHVKNLGSEGSYAQSPDELGIREDDVLKCKVIDIQKDRMNVELTAKPLEVESGVDASVKRDDYFHFAFEKEDLAQLEAQKRKITKIKKIRSLNHELFFNVDYRKAEEMMIGKSVGYCIIRPSTKGFQHLSLTWKFSEGVCLHVDVVEKIINGEKIYQIDELNRFSELDEILAFYIEPLRRNVQEIFDSEKFHPKPLDAMLIFVQRECQKVKRTVYGFIVSKDKPGRFNIVFMHLGGSRAKTEFIIVKPEGFLFRNKVHKTINDLIIDFKRTEAKTMKERERSRKAGQQQQQQQRPGVLPPPPRNPASSSSSSGQHQQVRDDRRVLPPPPRISDPRRDPRERDYMDPYNVGRPQTAVRR